MKKEIIEKITALKDSAINGDNKCLDVFLNLKEIRQALENSEKEIKDYAIDEAQSFEEKEFKYLGHKVALRNSAGRWYYSNVHQVKDAQDKLKSIQKLSQNAAAEKKHGNTIYDGDGVEIEPAIYQQGKTNIFITLSKD